LNQLESAQGTLSTEIQLLSTQKSNIENKLRELQKLLPDNMTDFSQWISHQNLLLQEQQLLREKLIQQQGLSAYAAHLHDGKNCPLCGSKEHPYPLSHQFDDGRLQENSRLYQQMNVQLEAIRKHQAAWERESLQLENVAERQSIKLSELSKTDREIAELFLKL